MGNRKNNKKRRIGVLISGRGSNLKAIIDKIESGYLNVEIAIVISDKREAKGLKYAEAHDIPSIVIQRNEHPSREAFESEIAAKLEAFNVELVVLAGFMRILSGSFIKRFYPNIINIHPSLLPSFPGLNAQAQAHNYGVKITGCTVHIVNESVDAGPIIIQAAIGVNEDDTEEQLSERILEKEHIILPMAIKLWSEDRIKLHGRKVKIVGQEGFIIG